VSRDDRAALLARAYWLTAAGLAATALAVSLDDILANRPAPLRRDPATRRILGREPGLGAARRLAIYLAVTHFAVPPASLARGAGMSRQQVSQALAAVEDGREDPALDARVEALAAALPAPCGRPWAWERRGPAWAA